MKIEELDCSDGIYESTFWCYFKSYKAQAVAAERLKKNHSKLAKKNSKIIAIMPKIIMM